MKKTHKNLFKFFFYIRSIFLLLKPSFFIKSEIRKNFINVEKRDDYEEIKFRVQYYNRLCSNFNFSDKAVENKKFERKGHISSYYFDLKVLLRCFPGALKFDYIFGDVTYIPEIPSFVKSRPIRKDNQNAILLKLDSVRHYYVYSDKMNYRDKLDLLVWRGAAHQQHRKYFVKNYYNHRLCNVGCVHRKSEGQPWNKPFMTVAEQLKYKFILSIEGNDVATNLKWIFASNSLCFMVKPKFETWFMEGLLKPGYHYVELKEDYSDVEEKVSYYIDNPNEAELIIKNANEHFYQFMDAKKERLISLLVMQKYFEKSNQMKSIDPPFF